MNRPPLERVRPALRPIDAYQVPSDPPAVKLDANESPWPLPDELQRRLASALAEVPLHRYPDPRATALRQSLAERFDVDPDELVLGAGSDELIALLMTALAEPPSGRSRAAVLYPEPTFVMYRMTALAHGLEPTGVELDAQWDLDLDAFTGAIARHRPNLIFLASPNNPTGNTFDDGRLRHIIEAASESLVVLDEAYAPFSERTLTQWTEHYPNLIVLGTLSKVGLAAARVGWARMHRDLAREVDKARQPFNLSALAQRTGQLALTEMAAALDAHVADVVRERARLARELASRDRLAVYPSSANFVLVRFEGNPDELAASLRMRQIAIKSFHRHGGRLAHHLRVTVGTPQQNDQLLRELAEALAECR